MNKKEAICEELKLLGGEGFSLASKLEKDEDFYFAMPYQAWYTKAIKAVASLAPDRLEEFRGYYEINQKRKTLDYSNYVIQDYMKSIVPAGVYPKFDSRGQTLRCFVNQINILWSIQERIDSVLSNIEIELYTELQDGEIAVARQLAKVSLRAAGALMGVVIEGHLQKVAKNHGVKLTKKNPTISDLNDPLKNAGVIDQPTWRKISFMADLRNLCSHKKDIEPTKDQVEELIQGAEWLIKTVF